METGVTTRSLESYGNRSEREECAVSGGSIVVASDTIARFRWDGRCSGVTDDGCSEAYRVGTQRRLLLMQ